MQKIWICGANGRVGRKMTKILKSQPVELLLTDMDDLDITVSRDVMEYANINRPHFIVNCAGMTDLGQCGQNKEEAFKVNALGARNLSIAARMGKARLVQFSTDDVFDGNSRIPYTEFDTPAPLTVYGKSKLAGENFVREFCSRHIIIRSSWIFGEGSPYLETILDMAQRGKTIQAAGRRFASPTGAKELAEKAVELMYHGEDGLYHVTGRGICSRYEFAKAAVSLLELDTQTGIRTGARVVEVNSPEDRLSAMRPSYSALDNMMLRISGIEQLPEWQVMLEAFMERRKKRREGRLVK